MLPLASFLLAALLGQASATVSEPPPCAAANVAGCLSGYVAKTDGFGQLVYVRDPDYVPPLARGAPARLALAHSEVVMPARASVQPAPAQPVSWGYPVSARVLTSL